MKVLPRCPRKVVETRGHEAFPSQLRGPGLSGHCVLESGANTNCLFTQSFVLNVDGRCVWGEEVKLKKQRDWWLDKAGVSPVTISQQTGKLL